MTRQWDQAGFSNESSHRGSKVKASELCPNLPGQMLHTPFPRHERFSLPCYNKLLRTYEETRKACGDRFCCDVNGVINKTSYPREDRMVMEGVVGSSLVALVWFNVQTGVSPSLVTFQQG